MANNTSLFYFVLVLLSFFDSFEARSSVIREHFLSENEADAATAHEDKEAADGNRDTDIVYAEQTDTEDCTLDGCLKCVKGYPGIIGHRGPVDYPRAVFGTISHKYCVGSRTKISARGRNLLVGNLGQCWCPMKKSWKCGVNRKITTEAGCREQFPERQASAQASGDTSGDAFRPGDARPTARDAAAAAEQES